ncbi:hypothetical protein RCG23_25255 [Neobacillus sp. PS3-34]|uniref:hypothetical protein n=1 Tax=Neobacillus sp. PS3-34 TaxID=3070678 RepID=UPI0027DF317F|nr:hypothetical protein [Neobacillus sp. PS3-34]WML48495.1 hypothetical protein RCG23_25255 [Neobacillus sp. PS3-34]
MNVINFSMETSKKRSSPHSVKDTLIKYFQREKGFNYKDEVVNEWEKQAEYIRSLFHSNTVIAMFWKSKIQYFLFETLDNNDTNNISLEILMISHEIDVDKSINTVIKDIINKFISIEIDAKPLTNEHIKIYPVIDEDIVDYKYSINALLKRGFILDGNDAKTLSILGAIVIISIFLSFRSNDYFKNMGFSLLGSAFISIIASISFKFKRNYILTIKGINDLININPHLQPTLTDKEEVSGSNKTQEVVKDVPLKNPNIELPKKKVGINV